jgi:hypothetical protein
VIGVGSGICKMVGFVISSVIPSGSTMTNSVLLAVFYTNM